MRVPWLNDWGEGSFLCHPYHCHHHYKACWWSLSSLMPDLFKIFHQQDLLQFGPPGHLGIRGNVESLNDATLLFQHVQPWRHWGEFSHFSFATLPPTGQFWNDTSIGPALQSSVPCYRLRLLLESVSSATQWLIALGTSYHTCTLLGI